MSRTHGAPMSTLRAFIAETLRSDGAVLDEKFTALDIVKLFSPSTAGGYESGGSEKKTYNTSKSYGKSGSGLTAVAVGNSQLGSKLGDQLLSMISSMGVKIDRMAPLNGGSASDVAADLEASIDGNRLAITFIGGNADTPSAATSAMNRMIDACREAHAHLIVIGPPPATRITDLGLAQKVFPDVDGQEDYFLNKDGGRFASNRVAVAEAIETVAMSAGGDVSAYGVAAHFHSDASPGSSDYYPPQPDGIHVAEGADTIAAEIVRHLDLRGVIDGLRPKIPQGGKLSDIIKRPDGGELSASQKEMVDLIEAQFTESEYTRPVVIAAVVNAYAESGLNPNADNADEDSVGLFQLNIRGAGKGMSVEKRKDPLTNVNTILDRESGPLGRIQASADSGAPIENLVAEFTKTVERPKDKEGAAAERVELYSQMMSQTIS